MQSSHDLEGLMKFLGRDEWGECFAEMLDEHLGPVLEAGDMDFEDLAEILGADMAMTLWGCAFEDFLTRDFEVQGGNIVDEYLRRRGWKESAQTKAYMKALRSSVMSLYEVSEVVPGKSLMARDLIRGGEPVAVVEGSATKTLKQWDRVAARIISVAGKTVLAGGLLPFRLEASEALFGGLRQIFGGRAKTLPALSDEKLREVAFIFTLSWLFDTLKEASTPTLQNSDGDALLFHSVRFALQPGVRQKTVATHLNTIPGLSQENAKFWNWLEDDPDARERTTSAGSHTFQTTMDNGLRVLGNVELKGRFLHLDANSARRAEEGTRMIQEVLAGLVRTPLTEIRTVEQMMADEPSRGSQDTGPDLPPGIAEQLVHELMDRQYRETLDQPVGMLGNRTPRQVARSGGGRRKVAEWLKYLENQTAGQTVPDDPMTTYSFEWMWRELGVLDLRR